MDNNVIQHLGRGHHQAPVKGKGPAAGTAAPAGVLPAYGDTAVGTACKLMIVRHSHGKIGCRRLAVSFSKACFWETVMSAGKVSIITSFSVLGQGISGGQNHKVGNTGP